eukprot:TRINITY_DN2344_c0_g1_i7.p1 TRINITY_DN2344_c0_g1~~TRINITY_DN2344_c0_g1_i7.p1  ORF type:complete len:130 (-),score=14.02 TRINITY_DN2344_c0_g1_i7:123-512(-)
MSTETRELIVQYTSTCVFEGKAHRSCFFRTSLCPDRCSHATTLYTFKPLQLDVFPNTNSSHLRWVQPHTQDEAVVIGRSDFNNFLDLADSLEPNDVVKLNWNHDYVTTTWPDGTSFSGPDRPVVLLEKV